MEYGAARCSAKCTTAPGANCLHHRGHEIVVGDIAGKELDIFPGNPLPGAQPLGHRAYRRQGLDAQLVIPLAPRKVIGNGNLVASLRKIQRRRPATVTVSAQHANLHIEMDRSFAPNATWRTRQSTHSTRCRAIKTWLRRTRAKIPRKPIAYQFINLPSYRPLAIMGYSTCKERSGQDKTFGTFAIPALSRNRRPTPALADSGRVGPRPLWPSPSVC